MSNRKTAKKQNKCCGAKKSAPWGSAEYLESAFDDIQSVEEMSRWCADSKRVKELVRSKSTEADGMSVLKVYRAKVFTPGDEMDDTSTVVELVLGRNGGGSQAAYFDALGRLARSGEFGVFDIHVDAVDDLVYVLGTYTRSAAKQGKGVRHG